MNPAAPAARARQLRAYADYQASVAEFRRRRAADEQARVDALLLDLVDALAHLPAEAACATCATCRRALPHGCRTCPYCKSRATRLEAA